MLFDDPIVLQVRQRIVKKNRVSTRVAFTRARSIIVKYFISSGRVIFHGKIQFYILLFLLYPAIIRFSQKICIKTFSLANHYFYTEIVTMNIARSLYVRRLSVCFCKSDSTDHVVVVDAFPGYARQ